MTARFNAQLEFNAWLCRLGYGCAPHLDHLIARAQLIEDCEIEVYEAVQGQRRRT